MKVVCGCGKEYWPNQAWQHAGCATNAAGVNTSDVAVNTPKRRVNTENVVVNTDRHAPGYMKMYMAVRRAVKAGRAEWLRGSKVRAEAG